MPPSSDSGLSCRDGRRPGARAVALAGEVDGRRARALASRLDARGVGGDRTHAVLHEHKGEWRPLTAREAPRLLAWRAAYPFAPDAGLRPGAARRYAHRDRARRRAHLALGRPAAAPRARADDLGRPVRLRARLGGHPGPRAQPARHRRGDAAPRSREELGRRDRPAPLPPQPPPRARRARLGRARLGGRGRCASRAASRCGCCIRACAARSPRATRTPRRSGPSCCATSPPRTATCFGINARVLRSGRVAADEAVAIDRLNDPRYRSSCIAPIRPALPRLGGIAVLRIDETSKTLVAPQAGGLVTEGNPDREELLALARAPRGRRSPRSWGIPACASWPPSRVPGPRHPRLRRAGRPRRRRAGDRQPSSSARSAARWPPPPRSASWTPPRSPPCTRRSRPPCRATRRRSC